MRLETLRYERTRDRQEALRQRLRELAAVRVRFGYRRLTVLLKREGWCVNAKRIYRLYDEEGLTVRTKPRKRLASRPRVPMPTATRPNERWSMILIRPRGITNLPETIGTMRAVFGRLVIQRAPLLYSAKT